MAISFLLNGREASVSRKGGAVLLDCLREDFGLTGTKEGCREGDCGACLVLLGIPQPDGLRYRTVNSCLLPAGDTAGRHVVTIEGLNQPSVSPIQQALLAEGAIQCGFCTPGLVVALTGFLLSGASLSADNGIAALGGNICRCTGYISIQRAAARLCKQFADLDAGRNESAMERTAVLVEHRILPRHFLDAPTRLQNMVEAEGLAAPGEYSPSRARVLVAGGTDLFVTQAETLRGADLAFLSRRTDLQEIRIEDGFCRIGAAAPLAEIEASPVIRQVLPDLPRHFTRVSSVPIRNRATAAGNIVNGSPAGDLSVMLLALNATLVLGRGDRRRRVLLRDFFKGYKVLDMAADEMIVEILFPVPESDALFHFEKVARRGHLDIASVNAAIQLRVQDNLVVEAHASAGSVAPVPLYLRKTSAFIQGQAISAAVARAAADIAAGEISPITDVRGSAEYKRALLKRLVLAHFLTLFPGIIGEEDLA